MSNRTAANEYIEKLSSEVKKKLPEYLQMNGISIEKNGSFRCMCPENHKNGDKTPAASMTEMPNGEYVWNCFVCHKGGDIYHAAQAIEGVSFDGPFFPQTVVYLAEKLGIQVDQTKIPTINPDTITRSNIYADITKFIADSQTGMECLMSGRFGRHYDIEEAEAAMKICTFGTVDSTALHTFLRGKYNEDQLKTVPFYNSNTGLLDPEIFASDVMTFPLMDNYGRPIAFCGRMTDEKVKQLKAEGKKVDKYKNSFGSMQYKKKNPFLFYEAQKHISATKKALLVEGQFDAVTSFIKGYNFVVPMMGCSLSQELMELITRKGIYEVIFAFDGDLAGIKAIRRSLDIAKLFKVSMKVVPIPSGKDPDSLLLENKDEFDILFANRVDAISYVIANDPDLNNQDLPKDVRIQQMIEFVCEFTSMHSKLREYSRVIARALGEEESDIFEDLKNFSLGQETRNTEVDQAWQKVEDARHKTFDEKISVLMNAQETIRRVAVVKEENIMQKSWTDFRALASGQTKLPTRLLTGIPLLDEHASIECGNFNALCGWPSNGKSSLMRSLMVDMLYKNDNLVFVYVSTDDHPKKTLLDSIALLTDLPKLVIRQHIEGMTFTENPETRQHLDMLQDMLSSRIVILGQDDAGSVLQIRKKVDIIHAQNPGKNICVVTDAMNNLVDVTNPKRGMDQRTGLEYATRELKNMAAATDNIAAIALLHLGKEEWRPGLRPTLGKIKGSGFMEYEAKVVLFSYIDLHYNRNSELIWRTKFGKMAPVMEVNIAKDKDREANTMIPMHFEPLVGHVSEPTKDCIEKYMKKAGAKYAKDEETEGRNIDQRF